MFFFFTSPLHSSYLFHSLHSSHLVLADTTYSEYLNILPHKWKYMHTLSPLPLFQVSSPNYIIPSPPIHLITTLSLPYSSHYFLILPLIHLLTTLSPPSPNSSLTTLFPLPLPFLPSAYIVWGYEKLHQFSDWVDLKVGLLFYLIYLLILFFSLRHVFFFKYIENLLFPSFV